MEENMNNVEKTTKQKFFIIFKLGMSILYFIPAFFIFGFGLMMNMFFLIGGAGASKNGDVSSITQVMTYIGAFSIIPAIICIILFIIALISTIKFFKNKYSKKMDLFISLVFEIINIALLSFAFWSAFYTTGIILSAFVIILLLDIIFIISDNKKTQKL